MTGLPSEQHLAGSRATLKLDGVAYNAGGKFNYLLFYLLLFHYNHYIVENKGSQLRKSVAQKG